MMHGMAVVPFTVKICFMIYLLSDLGPGSKHKKDQ